MYRTYVEELAGNVAVGKLGLEPDKLVVDGIVVVGGIEVEVGIVAEFEFVVEHGIVVVGFRIVRLRSLVGNLDLVASSLSTPQLRQRRRRLGRPR